MTFREFIDQGLVPSTDADSWIPVRVVLSHYLRRIGGAVGDRSTSILLSSQILGERGYILREVDGSPEVQCRIVAAIRNALQDFEVVLDDALSGLRDAVLTLRDGSIPSFATDRIERDIAQLLALQAVHRLFRTDGATRQYLPDGRPVADGCNRVFWDRLGWRLEGIDPVWDREISRRTGFCQNLYPGVPYEISAMEACLDITDAAILSKIADAARTDRVTEDRPDLAGVIRVVQTLIDAEDRITVEAAHGDGKDGAR